MVSSAVLFCVVEVCFGFLDASDFNTLPSMRYGLRVLCRSLLWALVLAQPGISEHVTNRATRTIYGAGTPLRGARALNVTCSKRPSTKVINKNEYFQCLTSELSNSKDRSIDQLEFALIECGFSPCDDGETYSLRRLDKVEIWQTPSVVSVTLFNQDKEVYFGDNESQDWDTLKLEYLLPWLPIENIDIYISKVDELCKNLGIKAKFMGEIFLADKIKQYAEICAANFEKRLEAPGGEFLAAAIQMDLPI